MAVESSRVFRVIEEGWVNGNTTILQGDSPVARFSFGDWKVQGKIAFEDGNYEVVRQRGLGSLLRLERDGVLVCETTIAGMWSKRGELSLDGVRYVVAWPAFDAKTILRRNGVEVGFVGKWRTWRRESDARFLESVPPMVCVFVMWLSTHKRRMDSAG